MSMQRDEIRWELYPHIAATAHARAFILRLCQFSRRPKTIEVTSRIVGKSGKEVDGNGHRVVLV